MALCPNCLKATHNEPLIEGLCKQCYEWRKEYEEECKEDKKEADKRRSSVLYQDEVLKVRYTGNAINFFKGQVIEAKPRFAKHSGLPYPEPKWIACSYFIIDEDGDSFPVAEDRYGELYQGFEWVR